MCIRDSYIDRRQLENDFYGLLFSINQKTDLYNAIIGGSFNIYDGQHYGEYMWSSMSKISSNFKEKFYDDIGDKSEFNVYAKLDYYLSEKISIYGDLQFRNINYNASITPYSGISGYVEQGYEEIDKNFNFSQFSNIDGIGDIQISSIKKFFSIKENLHLVQHLLESLSLVLQGKFF